MTALIDIPGQPRMLDGLELLGTSTLGDLAVTMWGSATVRGSDCEVELEDVAIAGTTISVETVIDRKQWKRLEGEAWDQYTKALAYVRVGNAAEWVPA